MSLSNLLSGSAVLCSIISYSVSDFLHANICLLASLPSFFQTQKKMWQFWWCFFCCFCLLTYRSAVLYSRCDLFFPTSVLVAFCDTSAGRVQYLRQLFSFPGLTASSWTIITVFLVCFDREINSLFKACFVGLRYELTEKVERKQWYRHSEFRVVQNEVMDTSSQRMAVCCLAPVILWVSIKCRHLPSVCFGD